MKTRNTRKTGIPNSQTGQEDGSHDEKADNRGNRGLGESRLATNGRKRRKTEGRVANTREPEGGWHTGGDDGESVGEGSSRAKPRLSERKNREGMEVLPMEENDRGTVNRDATESRRSQNPKRKIEEKRTPAKKCPSQVEGKSNSEQVEPFSEVAVMKKSTGKANELSLDISTESEGSMDEEDEDIWEEVLPDSGTLLSQKKGWLFVQYTYSI